MGIIKTILSGVVLIIISVLLLAMFFALVDVFPIDDDCLEEIAEDYCESNGMIFGNIYGRGFTCKEDERSFTFKAYRFLEEEIEDCKDE